jgi:hypothetical protein
MIRIPLIIGKSVADFQRPLALLSDCHRRIEHCLNLMAVVTGQARGNPLTLDQRRALNAALRYFRLAAPLHTRDEEESLFPRLNACPQPEVQERLDALEKLHADHAAMRVCHDLVDADISTWLQKNELDLTAFARLSGMLDEMKAAYSPTLRSKTGNSFLSRAGSRIIPKRLRSAGRWPPAGAYRRLGIPRQIPAPARINPAGSSLSLALLSAR